MLNKVKETIKKHNMLAMGNRIVVAVSGGPDSVALLKVLSMVSGKYRLSLVAAHLNHGLRGEESNSEERFARELCESMGIAFESKYIDVPSLIKGEKRSPEDVCRDVRYNFFKKVREKYKADKIALGHNLDDQAETVIMKFLRGSGMGGLRGILPMRDGIYIRPLISVTRDEILTFLKKEGMEFVTDSSNVEDIYLRNRIRNRLIPELRENYNPGLEENLDHTADIIRVEDDYIKTAVEDVLTTWGVDRNQDDIRVNIPELVKLHEAIQRRVIKTLLQNCSHQKKGIGYLHVKSVMDLITGGSPNGILNLPFDLEVRREYDLLVISKTKTPVGRNHEFHYTVEIPGTVNIKELGIKATFDLVDSVPTLNFDTDRTVFMDYENISFPLIIRNMKPGDRIQPFGMNGTKKVKSFFIDEKTPKNRRKEIPLLVDQKSVLWIMGMRLSERARITDKTTRVVKAEII
ncbi:MAG: tRNA lysidine(34) synthetase TilS [Proteobacteria bacterium]|nr:tRNA lysidine(34) synthetase TilS [Pseudomonadota bacterium]